MLYDKKAKIIDELQEKCTNIRTFVNFLKENALRPLHYDSINHFKEL